MRPAIGFKKIPCESYAVTNGLPAHRYARWDGKPKRCPLKGEYFISGSVPTAYIAKQDMTTEYFIAEVAT